MNWIAKQLGFGRLRGSQDCKCDNLYRYLFLILYLFHHLSPLPLVPAPFPRCWKPGHLPDASGMLGLTRLLVRNSPFRNTQLGRYTYSLPSVHWQVTFRALEILKVLSLARIPTITTTVTSPPSFVASPGPSFDV
jgi:hypothetical protein